MTTLTPNHISSFCGDQPLVLYELNEVPWRVVDWYVYMRPESTLAYILKNSITYTSFTRDEGELHPWTTWPTVHRGVTNKEHKISFINQNIESADEKFPPIWHTLQSNGVKVGVFGSLQSYSPSIDPTYAFYVPDTFSPRDNTWPRKYSAYQRFNLRQVRQDGAKARNIKLTASVISDVIQMLRSGLQIKTCLALINHLVHEKFNSWHCSRRSVLQALVAFDFFEDALQNSHPGFCTFFTNHVAGMMHRYWKYAFPDDFSYELSSGYDLFHSESILYAMDVADTHLSKLISYVSKRRGRLMIASSMGQEAVHRDAYQGEWRITNIKLFLRSIGWTKPAADLLSMQPDFNFSFDSEDDASQFVELASLLTDSNGLSIWKRIRQVDNTVNLGLSPGETALVERRVWLDRKGSPSIPFHISEVGIDTLNRDPGTGYHQPYGVVMITGEGIMPLDSRSKIDSTELRPLILNMLGISTIS